MAQLNKVFLMGNLTRDPELRRLPSGTAVTELGLALNRSYTNKSGERQDEVVYIDVTVWDRQAETCVEYLKRGRAVHVEGYLKMDAWEDRTTGEKRQKIKVQAERVQFLDKREGPGGSGGGDDEYSAPSPRESAPRESVPRRPYSETRAAGNGGPAPRSNYSSAPAPNPSRGRQAPPPAPMDSDDDDIPF